MRQTSCPVRQKPHGNASGKSVPTQIATRGRELTGGAYSTFRPSLLPVTEIRGHREREQEDRKGGNGCSVKPLSIVADHWDEADGAEIACGEVVAVARDDSQNLIAIGVADRPHEATAVGELREDGLGEPRRRGGEDDAIEWRMLQPSAIAVTDARVHVLERERVEALARLEAELVDHLDRM